METLETKIVSIVSIVKEGAIMEERKIREWILERSTDRFLSEGFSNFTMDEIARDAGVSKKTLYRLIPSKNKLILMVLDHQIEIIENKQRIILEDSNMSFKARLEAMFRIVSEFYSSIRAKSLQDIERLSPEIWEMVRQRREGALDRIIRLLEEGRIDGQIRNDISSKFLGRYFQSTIDSLISPRVMMEEDMTPNQLLDITLSLMFNGINKSPGGIYE